MPTYFVASGGSNTSPYDTWAKAATSLQTALTAANANDDVVVIQHDAIPTGDKETSANQTYVFSANILLISASNDGGSSYTPTSMGTSNWIGNSTTAYNMILGGVDKSVLISGVTFRGRAQINLCSAVGQDTTLVNGLVWSEGTTTNIVLNNTMSAFVHCIDCSFRVGATTRSISMRGPCTFIRCDFCKDGPVPTTLFTPGATSYNPKPRFIGCDFTSVTDTVVGSFDHYALFEFDRCSFASGAVILASQVSNPTQASAAVFASDCIFGSTVVGLAFYNAIGQAVSVTGTRFTSGAAGVSWEVATTSNAGRANVFETPWVDWYNAGTSAITPYIECLRNDGTATAYSDQQVWAEFSFKNTSSSPLASGYVSDRDGLVDFAQGTNSSAQAAGAGTGSWTIASSNSPASFKYDSGGSITPTQAGYIRGRIVVAQPSITVYVDPQIRT